MNLKQFNITLEELQSLERGNVDLRTCKSGDILLSALGGILEYVRPTDTHEYLDHYVKYLHLPDSSVSMNNNFGTRTHDGFVFKKKRIPETDHDIVKIIHI